MSESTETPNLKSKATGILSLDTWAVLLALGLSLLVWIGLIKKVPWKRAARMNAQIPGG